MTHIPKSVTYTGIALISIFIIAASFWYKREFLKTPTSPNFSGVKIGTSEKNRITEKTKSYLIEVEYPTISASLKGNEDANVYFMSIYKKRVEDFKKQAQESYDNAPKELISDEGSSYYNVSFTEEASSSRFVSLFVSSEIYFIGMAHPSHGIDTYIFDKKNNALVTVDDLFIASSSYRNVLSELSKDDFNIRKKIADADEAIIATTAENEGFAPTAENFSRVLPLTDGLAIYFTEYQIAPYSSGPQQVVIPYGKLQSIINPNGVLGDYK